MILRIFPALSPTSDHLRGLVFAILAGVLWSFGPVIVRYMTDADLYRFQYLFYRGIGVVIPLLSYLAVCEGVRLYQNFLHVGFSGVLGAASLASAMICFIVSITQTSAAITLFMLAAMPFISAIFAYIALREGIRRQALLSMAIAFVGIMVMIYDDSLSGDTTGALLGLASAAAFSLFTVSLRWRKGTPKFTTIILAGLFCSVAAFVVLHVQAMSIHMPAHNVFLSLLHGLIVGSGLILYTVGARTIPAAELTLLSLLEIVGGIIWVALPVFGINEVPSLATLAGGGIVILAILLNSLKVASG